MAESEVFQEEAIEEKPVEETVVEEPVDFAKFLEASTETQEDGQIRFAEEILRTTPTSEAQDKAKSGAKGKAKGGRYKKQTDELWGEELDE